MGTANTAACQVSSICVQAVPVELFQRQLNGDDALYAQSVPKNGVVLLVPGCVVTAQSIPFVDPLEETARLPPGYPEG